MLNVLTQPTATQEVESNEYSMTLDDGLRLFYRAWIPAEPTRKAMIIFHRGHEHSGRLEDVVRSLGLTGIAVFAWDARGHGRSGGPRGYAPTFGRITRDADEFIRYITETHGFKLEDMVVLGHSVGAVTVAAWVHDYAPPIRAMILVTPALRVRLYVPFARTALRIARFFIRRKPMFVSSYVKGRLLTHDDQQARRYDEDPLISKKIAVNILLGLHDTATRLMADAAAIRTPTLVLAGGSDWVVNLGAERKFFDRLGSSIKRMRVFEGMYHDILHETGRRAVLNDIRVFVRGAFARDGITIDKNDEAYTRSEYDRLRAPLPRLSAGRLWFATQKAFLKTYGRLSNGIRLGWRNGFDSGSSLDYVYENRARGALLLGRIIDRVYLNNVAWAGIRQRKTNIEKLLVEAVLRVRESGNSVRILDVATGQGRYVLDSLKALGDQNVTAILRDYSASNVEAGRALAAELGLKGVAFEQADAFDEASYESMNVSPNIAIVSGLFELFPENAPVRHCLTGIASSIEDGGFLIYTGQPWHPQIEMIARVLTNREGEPWVMRRRTQRELDELVSEAGFEKIKTEVGGRGIFTVSIARKRGRTSYREPFPLLVS